MVTTDFSIRVSDADESYDDKLDLFSVPKLLAQRKALATQGGENEIIIGCDTVVIYGGELMGKPKDRVDAIRMLWALSGTTHAVVSGICIHSKEKTISEAVTTYVTFRSLTEGEICSYVDKFNPTDKAGAYGIQEAAGAFVERIEGDFYNVVGLPLCRLCQLLREEFNIEF